MRSVSLKLFLAVCKVWVKALIFTRSITTANNSLRAYMEAYEYHNAQRREYGITDEWV